jgi:hypothetical protein
MKNIIVSNWTAPKSVKCPGTWHIIMVGNGLFQAGHFALTGHGDALDARSNKLPSGRTPGRALRAFRRKLECAPVSF